jgi:predicted nucleic acid-binding protein
VEYWRGNEAVKPWVEEHSHLFSSTITFTETVRYFVSEGVDPEKIHLCLEDIRLRCTVVPVDEEIAISAGHLKNREVEGIADAVILATARAGGHQVVTGDPHFQDIGDAVFLGQG